jgi:tRNA isopentenyl-2-thiomethyl-A-37 hydroxylase MiaE
MESSCNLRQELVFMTSSCSCDKFAQLSVHHSRELCEILETIYTGCLRSNGKKFKDENYTLV